MKKLNIILLLAISCIWLACKKDIDTPPENILPEGSVITIDSLRAMFQGKPLKIEDDLSVYATVTMDEGDGNIYKNIYVQDETGAINLRLPRSGGFFEGDYVRIALKGTIVSEYNGVFQVDSIDTDRNLIKQASDMSWTPRHTGLDSVLLYGTIWESQLLHINDVQFKNIELGEPYADYINESSLNHTLVDCNGNEIIVRSSGFSDFARENLAEGKGDITCVLSHYNGELQLYIRSFDEINFSGQRCDDGTKRGVYKNRFEIGDLTFDGWQSQVVTGVFNWEKNGAGGNNFAEMSNFAGGNSASEVWLISPGYDLTTLAAPILEFTSARRYNGDAIQVMVSTDYDGKGPVGNATWSQLFPILPPSNSTNYVFTPSGELDLSSYGSSTNFYLAFKYVGTDNDGATWRIDDILIREKE